MRVAKIHLGSDATIFETVEVSAKGFGMSSATREHVTLTTPRLDLRFASAFHLPLAPSLEASLATAAGHLGLSQMASRWCPDVWMLSSPSP